MSPRGRGEGLRHLLYLLGGVWGALIGIVTSISLHSQFGWELAAAVVVGLVANTLFNLWFSVTFLWLRQIPVDRTGASYASFLLLSAILVGFGLAVLFVATTVLKVPSAIASVMVFLSTSLLSLLTGRIWVFVSPSRAYKAYEALDESFYADSGDAQAVGRFRAWYHRGRWNETLRQFRSVYRSGDTAYDLGSGGSEWNTDGLPVIGLDVNESLLRHGQSVKRIASYVVAPLAHTGVESASADIVVLTEVLEHIDQPFVVLAEIRRILKPQGQLILSVPNDWILSPFFWLFNLQCFYRGYILGEDYYRERCGHVNHFTPKLITGTLAKAGFRVHSMNVFRRLLIFTVSRPAQ